MSILQHNNTQKQKLEDLLKISSNNIFSDRHNHERVICNFSLYELNDDEKKAMCKDLNFSVKLRLIEYSAFLPFELLFRDIKCEDLCSEDMSFIKARLLDPALNSHQNFQPYHNNNSSSSSSTCTMTTRIPLTSESKIFVICLT